MLGWIILAVVIYLVIGLGILLYGAMTDPYGGYLLQFWWLIILLYPYLAVRSLLSRIKKE